GGDGSRAGARGYARRGGLRAGGGLASTPPAKPGGSDRAGEHRPHDPGRDRAPLRGCRRPCARRCARLPLRSGGAAPVRDGDSDVPVRARRAVEGLPGALVDSHSKVLDRRCGLRKAREPMRTPLRSRPSARRLSPSGHATPTLYVFAGLPGSGKTTLSQLLARRVGATHLRIDTVEQALRDLCALDVQGEGYRLSYRIAADNLRLGLDVIADSCNPIQLTRDEWRRVAIDANARAIDIEVVCSDPAEHRGRVEGRASTVLGLRLPTWKEVEDREYHA